MDSTEFRSMTAELKGSDYIVWWVARAYVQFKSRIDIDFCLWYGLITSKKAHSIEMIGRASERSRVRKQTHTHISNERESESARTLNNVQTVYVYISALHFRIVALTNRYSQSQSIGWKCCAHKYSTFNLFAIWSCFKENITFTAFNKQRSKIDRPILFDQFSDCQLSIVLIKMLNSKESAARISERSRKQKQQRKKITRKIIKCVKIWNVV